MKNKLKILLSVVMILTLLIPSLAFADGDRNIQELKDSVRVLEIELEKSGTDVSEELNKAINYYEDIIEKEDLDDSSIEQLKEQIFGIRQQLNDYNAYKEGRHIRGVYHPIYSVAVSAVNAYFINKGYMLSSELITHAAANDVLDSYYYPSNGRRVKSSPVFNKIKRSNKTSGSDEFPNSGNSIQRDLYYSIHLFDWEKGSNGLVLIKDRYDFSYGDYEGIAGIAINTMYLAQEAGVIVPFQVRIRQ